MHNLPQLKGTHVYQGWVIQNNQPRSLGLLTVQNGIAALNFPENINVQDYETAAVSLESDPQATQNAPQGPVVAAGSLKNAVQAAIAPPTLSQVRRMAGVATVTTNCFQFAPDETREEGCNAYI